MSHEYYHRPRRRYHRSDYSHERNSPEDLPYIPYLHFGDIIGHGNFSHVYDGIYHHNTPVAIKVIERGSERLIDTEIKLLQALIGSPHVIQLLEVIDAGQTMLVFEVLHTIDRDKIFDKLNISRMRFILRCVLEALRAAHAAGIVHRDVKLGNILIAHDFSNVILIDWGCGAFVSDSLSTKAGSRSSRPPEMLFGYRGYETTCDIWAVGVLILYCLSGGVIPWKSRNSHRVLSAMSLFFGGKNLMRIAHHLNLNVDPELENIMAPEPERDLASCFDKSLAHLFDPDLIDLMHELMNIDSSKRPTANQALSHRFFTKT